MIRLICICVTVGFRLVNSCCVADHWHSKMGFLVNLLFSRFALLEIRRGVSAKGIHSSTLRSACGDEGSSAVAAVRLSSIHGSMWFQCNLQKCTEISCDLSPPIRLGP